jgi:hypothetical protein
MALQNANTGATTAARVHHSAIVVRDFDASLRSVFLGDPARADAGIVDPDGVLVELIGIPSP